MSDFDVERYDRARVACLLLGEPEPPTPVSDGAYLAPFIAFAAVQTWCHFGRSGSCALPRDLVGEYCAYVDLPGWHNDPHFVGLLNGLEHRGWHPSSATLNFEANPYRTGLNQTSFENGCLLARTAPGQRYRTYVANCRTEAATSAQGMRLP